MSRSIIYQNVYFYRLIMNLLYPFQYQKRFEIIAELLRPEDRQVVELCFGDTYLAKFCRENGKSWIGFDLNESFVKTALTKGYKALHADISEMETIPESDVCIMIGSLYHFYPDFLELFRKIRKNSKKFILSEPIKNLTHKKGFIHWLSQLLTNAGKGIENFRFNEASLIETMEKLKNEMNFSYRVVSKNRDMVLEITW